MKRQRPRVLNIVGAWILPFFALLASCRDFQHATALISSQFGSYRSPGQRHDARSNRRLQAESSSSSDETRRLIEAQQKQIDKLLELLSNKASSETDPFSGSSRGQGAQVSLPPLKVMLFIDGTWLYYSLNTRDEAVCPIQKKFGVGWQRHYAVDWKMLPRVIGQALQEQDAHQGWMPTFKNQQAQGRPVEVVRVSVYTSFRSDTPKTSIRYQMFQDMIQAKYDVLMLETIGHNEKCVDIQLAVDMLHYATVPDAYDVAVLLSGDKDFVPAMVRTRQKGRRVALASVRGYSATRTFYDTPNIKDFDVIWLDDYLDQIIKPKTDSPRLWGNRPQPLISPYTISKVIADFIEASGAPSISSRDIGRYIKTTMVGDRCILDEVKEIYGGLYQFVTLSEIFTVDTSAPVRDFWVGLDPKVSTREGLKKLKEEKELVGAEMEFFATYSAKRLRNKAKYYEYTLQGRGDDASVAMEVPDYNDLLVEDLKDICRERGLKVSGKKSELIERIIASDEAEKTEKRLPPRVEGSAESSKYLESLLLEYLHAKGGHASSRDVGRYLTANKPSSVKIKNEEGVKSALEELKKVYGSVRQFIAQSPKFIEESIEEGDEYEFLVRAAG